MLNYSYLIILLNFTVLNISHFPIFSFFFFIHFCCFYFIIVVAVIFLFFLFSFLKLSFYFSYFFSVMYTVFYFTILFLSLFLLFYFNFISIFDELSIIIFYLELRSLMVIHRLRMVVHRRST